MDSQAPSSQTHQEVPELLYVIIPIVVCNGFKIIQIEIINLLNDKNEVSYSDWEMIEIMEQAYCSL